MSVRDPYGATPLDFAAGTSLLDEAVQAMEARKLRLVYSAYFDTTGLGSSQGCDVNVDNSSGMRAVQFGREDC
eukprot:43165-Rhodomonas_salina.1